LLKDQRSLYVLLPPNVGRDSLLKSL